MSFFNHFIHFLGNLSRCFSITLGLCVLLKNEIIVSFWQKSEYSTFESNKLYIYNTDLHTRLAFNLCSWNYSPKMWWICNSSVSRQVYCTSGRWWEHHRYKLLWCVILIRDGPKQGCYGATRAYRDKDLLDRPHLVVKDSITFTLIFSNLQFLTNCSCSLLV